MNAVNTTPAIPPNGELTPSRLNTQPPTNAPTMPMMMSPIRPYPVPPITSDASTPAIRPTMIQVSKLMPVSGPGETATRGNSRASAEAAPLGRAGLLAALSALVLAAACSPSGTAIAAAPAPVRQAVTESDVRRLLGALSDDSLEGRMTASRGSARAAKIIAEEMRRIGLEPAGDSGYFQRVPIGLVSTRGATRPVLFSSFAALDSLPADRRPPSVNVVGILRGTDPVVRDSAVLIDAHYDHLGIGAPVAGDSIYNGADDDASGVVAVLEIARALAAGPTPRRTVIFATTTGEEVGLLGTRWYLKHPVVPIAEMSANLEIEMIGRPDSAAGGPGRGWLTGFDRSTMGKIFAKAGLPIVADHRLDQHFFERSDNIAFARLGVPAHTLSSYGMHGDYHKPSDDLAHVDIAHMTALIRAGAAGARLLADGPAPHWNPNGRPASPQ